ncbi:hypothetical protein ACOT81_24070 [Streptomyces sp. WI04-05B]|uniref:hypothetical protein n=1 Tax=Streptomyces TaxID=1883 RepID=UPI0029BDD1D1|nr:MULTISPECIES: hypothetical protein [unclassified Streptomyces]MDX2542900.1 hypothetical protein [Streptomyces sp. WI04-05B]MDX2588444.1 hypothetical protein [Streptomyces sp. WI04-05A]MDX3747246.1 hypothetical protein [Streptomyces sp. AK08-02]
MIEGMDHLPTTEAAVTALRALAAEYSREIEVGHDIGADQTSRRTAAGIGVTTDPDGSLPHEAFAEFGGVPRVTVRLFPDDDALITVEGVECHDIARDDVPAFLRSVYDGLAFVAARRFPHTRHLVVPLPGDRTYKEYIPLLGLSPWLSSRIR